MQITSNRNLIIAAVVLFLSLACAALSLQSRVFAGVTQAGPTVTRDTTQYFNFFASTTGQTNFATTTTATSTSIIPYFDSNGRLDNGYFVIAGAKKVTIYVSRGDTSGQGNTGTSTFNLQITSKANPTSSDWFNFSKLVQATSTTEQPTAAIAAATSTLRYGMDIDYDSVYAVRCIVVETTDGEHSCAAMATF